MSASILRSVLLSFTLLACSNPSPPPPPTTTPVIRLEEMLDNKSSAVTTIIRAPRQRSTLNAIQVSSPSSLRATVTIPTNGRLDLSLGVPEGSKAITFKLIVEASERPPESLFEVTTDQQWTQKSVPLGHLAGEQVTFVLETTSTTPAQVGLWGAPTLSGIAPQALPNILFYVIDGAGADLMSLYDYERPTTPNISRIASDGVVFEQARTTSAWTKPSTASFMTSLHHSVLGGFTKNEDQIPPETTTMAEHFHAAGYQTAVLTTNPFAGSMSGLQAGVDLFRDQSSGHNSASSRELHDDFWRWREEWPGGPWWVHIQTTDVHEPHRPIAPYAGLYINEERRALFEKWWKDVHKVKGVQRDTVLARYQDQLTQLGVDPKDFFRAQWDLYDETMTQNDAYIGELVDDLKARGEWANTILIIASDHGHPAGSFSRFGRGLIEPAPADWEGALSDSYRTHIPLVVVWPGHLKPGLRVKEPVSMIDLLPTLLELSGLPAPTILQGRSLVPLLNGTENWPSKPVIIEQVQAYPPTGEMVGHIEVIDGQWAASLQVMPESLTEVYSASTSLATAGGWRAARPHRPSTPELLLYDLSTDPFCLQNVNADHPEKVASYTTRLSALWEQHQDLGRQFQKTEPKEAGEAQIEALRLLGYVE